MNTKFKFTGLMVFLILLASVQTSLAEEKTKEFYENWSAESVQSLVIENKFGEVKVLNNRTDSVTIHVIITVEARDEKRADEMLDMMEVDFRKNGSQVKATTKIEHNFKSQRKFNIDYVVNIPSDKDLRVTNKYGHTFINELLGKGEFEISYGNFTANRLMGESTTLELNYGKSAIEEASEMDILVNYSGIVLGEAGNVKVNSKYSALDIEEGKTITIESKYDKFNFEEVESVFAKTKYSHLKIDELSQKLEIESGYGSIKIREVGDNFESISITNSYGKISLGLDDIQYSIDAECQYCGIDYPEDDFTGNRISENNHKTINGKIGTGAAGKVVIKSRYGDISLME